MKDLNVTSIILGVITLLSSCGWFVNWRNYRQEAKGKKKDNKQKDMDLSKVYVDEFNKNIVSPLLTEVRMLRYAIQQIDRCPHRANCPVLNSMPPDAKDDKTGKPTEDDGHRH